MSEPNVTTTLQTLSRGLAMLEAIAAADGAATAKTLSRALGLQKSTCYHLLRTLQHEGFIVRLPHGTYAVGGRGARLGRAVVQRTGPDPAVLSAMLARLQHVTRETVYISGWRHGIIALQEWIPGPRMLSVGNLDIGYTGNLHARASCKAILAHLPPSEAEAMLPGGRYESLTANTICTWPEYASELMRVKKQGYAVDDEEFEAGVMCISSAFFGADGTPAGAFTVAAPASRARTDMTFLSTRVRDTADRATAFLRLEATRLPISPGTADTA